MSEISKLDIEHKNIRIIYNFTILDKFISKNIYLKKLSNYYNINIKLFKKIKKNYNLINNILLNTNNLFLSDNRNFKIYYRKLNKGKKIKNYIKYNSLIEQKYTYLDKALVNYSLNNKNYYYFLKHNLRYNKEELSMFKMESELYFKRMNFDLKKINYIKDCINIFSKVLMREGKYIKVYNLIEYSLLQIKLKGLNLYDFFQNIFEKLYLPISLYKKKVAGRKILVPNPYNLNYMNKKLWHSARLIERSLKNRKEKSFKDRFLSELLDIYYDKGDSISIKKRTEFINIIKDNKLNMRYLKKKRKN